MKTVNAGTWVRIDGRIEGKVVVRPIGMLRKYHTEDGRMKHKMEFNGSRTVDAAGQYAIEVRIGDVRSWVFARADELEVV